MSSDRPTIDELLARLEIQDLFTRYTYHHDVIAPRFATGEVDGTEMDMFDDLFTSDAVLDFTKSGATRADVATMKEFLPGAYASFPVQHHLMGQTEFTFSANGDEANTRTWMINPMGFRCSDGSIHVYTTGGYYLDHVVRTEAGWRIKERVYDQQWMMGELPAELMPPE